MREIRSAIAGVVIKPLMVHTDARGWLAECFRSDELDPELLPAMSYLSWTKPGVARGPHEHIEQTDIFAFPGPGAFRLILWDNRTNSKTFGLREEFEVGADNPAIAIVPPRVVHAYKNVSDVDGLVLNYPNKLYAGEGKRDKVDDVRYEGDANSKFIL